MPDPSFHEYGYNAGMHVQMETNQGQSDFNLSAPVENLIGKFTYLTKDEMTYLQPLLQLLHFD